MQDVMKITNNSPLVAALVYLSAWDMAGTPPMSKSEMGQHNSTPHCLFFWSGDGIGKKGICGVEEVKYLFASDVGIKYIKDWNGTKAGKTDRKSSLDKEVGANVD